jgi:hypothetical protein
MECLAGAILRSVRAIAKEIPMNIAEDLAAIARLNGESMSIQNSGEAANRRTVLTSAVVATGFLLGGVAWAQQSGRGPFTVEGWQASWANPSPDRVRQRVPTISKPDIRGYWPRTTRPVQGQLEYAQRIIDLITFIPDFRAEMKEYAINGDVMFIRWLAKGTSPAGPFEARGADRLILADGFVAENLILSDHPVFAAFAKHVGDLRSEG